ncbi:hypothetical protein ANCCEY_05971 [Ancylostoma ceylanicum]|uniref:DM13 domain-containing protein n=1 Tax=Ancylostoma ceylanicum TaxID=53326 RepID=A0A0D6LSW2_9BILA|nr:hypothetical protein ANCCEY_05971 [Ancylostoma ceylanicum]
MSSSVFSALLLATSATICTTQVLPYYGVPLGTFKYDKLGIHGEIYLADDHTIVLDKFVHNPQTSACTAMMIGPPRKEDMKRKLQSTTQRCVKMGEGILLPYTQPNFSWEEIRRRQRRRVERGDIKATAKIRTRLEDYNATIGSIYIVVQFHYEQPVTLSSIGPEESYEEIEYVEDEEETEEREESVNRLLPTFKMIDSLISFSKKEKLQQRQEKTSPPFLKLHDDLSTNEVGATPKAVNYDSSFSLPPAQDEQVAFLLTNCGRLSDYKWIGLYDQCKNVSIPIISLEDVDPPREEEVGPMIGQERNISSGSVRILNCNTILVPDLYFEANQKSPNSFFFVGTGNVTNVVQQTKARTIGYELGDPLESYAGDDVMVRLPRGIRSFDVDFLSIFNEDEKKTYGHVELPSLLVPPCVDELKDGI